jgi:hypothetical protein
MGAHYVWISKKKFQKLTGRLNLDPRGRCTFTVMNCYRFAKRTIVKHGSINVKWTLRVIEISGKIN